MGCWGFCARFVETTQFSSEQNHGGLKSRKGRAQECPRSRSGASGGTLGEGKLGGRGSGWGAEELEGDAQRHLGENTRSTRANDKSDVGMGGVVHRVEVSNRQAQYFSASDRMQTRSLFHSFCQFLDMAN